MVFFFPFFTLVVNGSLMLLTGYTVLKRVLLFKTVVYCSNWVGLFMDSLLLITGTVCNGMLLFLRSVTVL